MDAKSPTICLCELGNQESWWYSSVLSKSLRTWRLLVEVLESKGFNVWGQEKIDISVQEEREFTLPSHFCSIWALKELGDAHPLVAQMVKNLPAMQETQARSLGWEDPQKGMATHSSILAWRIPWTEEPGGLQSMGSQRVGHDWLAHTHPHGKASLERFHWNGWCWSWSSSTLATWCKEPTH